MAGGQGYVSGVLLNCSPPQFLILKLKLTAAAPDDQ